MTYPEGAAMGLLALEVNGMGPWEAKDLPSVKGFGTL